MSNILLEIIQVTPVDYGTDVSCSNKKIMSSGGNFYTYFINKNKFFYVNLNSFTGEYEFAVSDTYSGFPGTKNNFSYNQISSNFLMYDTYGKIFWLLFEIIREKNLSLQQIIFAGNEEKLYNIYSKLVRYKNITKIFQDNGYYLDEQKLKDPDTYPYFIFKKSIMEEKTMSIFQSILQEVLENKPFNTIGELKDLITQVLKQHSKLSFSSDTEFKKFGFRFKTYKREFRIVILGDDSHTLIAALKKVGIHCRYSSVNDTVVIRFEDNVSKSGLLSTEAQEEIDAGTYGLIGYVTADKDNPQFFDIQEKLFTELNKYGMIEWIPKADKFVLQLKGI